MRWDEVSTEAAVGIFCPHGVRASIAYTYLRARGKINVRVLDGGYAGIAEMARPGAVLASLKVRN
jgi:rhodanese-related sulfurtransferase